MSSPARLRAIVAALAVAAAAVAVAVAWTGQEDADSPASETSGPRPGAPPLVLDVLLDDDAEALQNAALLYQEGEREAARDAFEEILAGSPDSLPALVGEAMARWPDGTLEALRALEAEHADSGLVKLHLGLALYWLRQDAAAEAAWREVEEVAPDSPAAIRAETLLHPEMPDGRPFFVTSAELPAELADLPAAEQLERLEQAARDGGDEQDWLLYGVALQRLGFPVSAESAFARAAELAPDDPEALAAAAVGAFDKDDPSRAFSQLGPLSDRFPDAAVVRFHLGLMLLWLSQVEEAREHLQAAIEAEPESVYAREARLVLERLDEAAGGATDAGSG